MLFVNGYFEWHFGVNPPKSRGQYKHIPIDSQSKMKLTES